MNKLKKLKKTICATVLCWRFPFLKPRQNKDNFWQSTCWYYSVDFGWRRIFLQMCEEIRDILKRDGKELTSFVIYDLKQKYGYLDINCNSGLFEDTQKIVEKYEYISFLTCNICGRPAFGYTKGWILPYCKNCAPKNTPIYKFGTQENKWYGAYSLLDNGKEPIILEEEKTQFGTYVRQEKD